MGINRVFFTLIVFLFVYIFFAIVKKRKYIVIWAGIILFVTSGIIKPSGIITYVNWNIIGIFVGFLIITDFMAEANIPARLAKIVVDKSKSLFFAVILMSIFSGIISMFLENVATVLILAPIAIEISRKARVSPVPFLLGITLSSNLQGTATLIGDPPSMILAGYTKMTFMDFFVVNGKLSIFFAVEIGAIVSLFVIGWIYRRLRNIPIDKIKVDPVKSYIPLYFFVIAVLYLFFVSLSHKLFGYAGGIGSMIIAIILVLVYKRDGVKVLRRFDYETLLILMGIFILIRGITEAGVVSYLVSKIELIVGNNLGMTFVILVVTSVFLSAFIDNVPYVTAMIPIGIQLANSLGTSPYLFTFGILIGATVGGNITPVGAAANIVTWGVIQREGIKFKFSDFVKVGLPFTIGGVTASALFLWFIWK